MTRPDKFILQVIVAADRRVTIADLRAMTRLPQRAIDTGIGHLRNRGYIALAGYGNFVPTNLGRARAAEFD
ncbi:winged helix DNA-binding protein [Tsukamurella paurometabola]|uniref:Winged helix-turn-helix domain-containing protein n=1 Tax=Tsukamurella paurometabola TaxID=2061 RepID=A0ABS5NJ52_TSUPA|nr:winged helix DNA-binding protein [Tsukamurella paurometabola]MBS4104308.1 hypothetical protein [Tsukamurella paurometabola]